MNHFTFRQCVEYQHIQMTTDGENTEKHPELSIGQDRHFFAYSVSMREREERYFTWCVYISILLRYSKLVSSLFCILNMEQTKRPLDEYSVYDYNNNKKQKVQNVPTHSLFSVLTRRSVIFNPFNPPILFNLDLVLKI
jgi:hypothetical protein